MDASKPHPGPTKAERFNIRVTNEEKALVEQAARTSHVSASQFILQAVLRSAEEVLADQTAFVLPPAQWDAFVERLDEPARVVPELERAARESDAFGGR